MESLLLAAGILLLLAAALHDIATRTIPNGLVLGVVGVGLSRQTLTGETLSALAVAAIVLGVTILCWRRGYLGGGDAKLLPATSLMVPANQVMALIAATAIAGGVLALLYLVAGRVFSPQPLGLKRNSRHLAGRILRVERRRLRRGITLPYATAIAAGTLFVLWRG